MKKVLLLALLIALSASALAGYSYTVSGKVYMAFTTTPVPNAAVTHTVHWPGGTTSGSTISANDGSFTFTLTSDTWDFKGVTMNLKATTGLCSGGTTWTCKTYSEIQDVYISCRPDVHPDLSVAAVPSHPGTHVTTLPLTVVGSLDQPMFPVMVQHFQILIAWDPSQLNLSSILSSPMSLFHVTGWMPGPDPGTAIVSGSAPIPVELPADPMPPDSFFDVFFEILLPGGSLPAITAVTVSDESELIGPEIVHPYRNTGSFLLGILEPCPSAFLIASYDQWQEALNTSRPRPNIRPSTATWWNQYMANWSDPTMEHEGEPYPESQFIPPLEPDGMLYVFEGGGGGPEWPEDAGLVMAWGTNAPPAEGNYAAAWQWDFGMDPDLSNSTIQVTVTPPAVSNITAVSFSIVDAANRMRTWWWSVPGAIPGGVATTVKINTALTGIAATTPPATGYMSVPGFDITNAQFFDVDENFNYIFTQQPVPPPGVMLPVYAWNYWHNLIVTKNTSAYKGTWPKYSQPLVVLNEEDTAPTITGWDEVSVYDPPQWPIMADDWQCVDDRPVTDIHWWGSFKGWTQPYLPPVLPKAFHIGIWTDVPDPDPANPQDYSHPGRLIWEHVCDNWVWNFAGYDLDPRCEYPEMPCEKNEACFQFNQLLSQDDWFYQQPSGDPNHPNIYWLSIAAIYEEQEPVTYPWGWKTRPHFFQDDAVRILSTADGTWPPVLGSLYGGGIPLQLPEYPDPQGVTWDLAFELTTNQEPPCHDLEGDINHDCTVDLDDLTAFAADWLKSSP